MAHVWSLQSNENRSTIQKRYFHIRQKSLKIHRQLKELISPQLVCNTSFHTQTKILQYIKKKKEKKEEKVSVVRPVEAEVK